jgi:hypothetical protein
LRLAKTSAGPPLFIFGFTLIGFRSRFAVIRLGTFGVYFLIKVSWR